MSPSISPGKAPETLSDVTLYLDQLLNTSDYNDTSLNGLQVESTNHSIKKVAFAVDSGEMVIEKAIAEKADLLVVHHGLFWGALERITGPLARKIGLLLNHGCSLYASHLPLDGDPVYGNGVELAALLGLTEINRAFNYRGADIGVIGKCASDTTLEDLIARTRDLAGVITPTVIRAGKTRVSRVGVVTGSGSFAIQEAARLGLDVLVSGEPKQEAFHLAHELKINALFLGHYATETLGVLALKRHFERQFPFTTLFIDIPTGI